MTIPSQSLYCKVLEKTIFQIKIVFRTADLKFQVIGFFIRVDVVPSDRLQFLISQFLSGGVILYVVWF